MNIKLKNNPSILVLIFCLRSNPHVRSNKINSLGLNLNLNFIYKLTKLQSQFFFNDSVPFFFVSFLFLYFLVIFFLFGVMPFSPFFLLVDIFTSIFCIFFNLIKNL